MPGPGQSAEKPITLKDVGAVGGLTQQGGKVVEDVGKRGLGDNASTQDAKALQRIAEAAKRIEKLNQSGG